MPKQTFDLKDVEIFSAGKWNNDIYTEKDLDEIVESFNKIGKKIKPFMKLGHANQQALLQKDGYPAAGWITALKRIGTKLLADISAIPRKIKELIENKAYGRFSPEIYINLTDGDKKYPYVLKGIALLGGDTPACTTINDFIDLYTLPVQPDPDTQFLWYYTDHTDDITFETAKDYHVIQEEKNMPDDVKKLEEELKTKNAEIAKMGEALKSYEKKFSDLEATVKQITGEKQAIESEKKMSEIKAYIDDKVKAGVVLPSQVPFVYSLACDPEMLKEKDGFRVYSYTDEKKEEKEIKFKNNFELVKNYLDNGGKVVDFSQKTETTPVPKPEGEDVDGSKLDAKIKDYAEKNNLSYRDAYIRVMNENEQKEEN